MEVAVLRVLIIRAVTYTYLKTEVLQATSFVHTDTNTLTCHRYTHVS